MKRLVILVAALAVAAPAAAAEIPPTCKIEWWMCKPPQPCQVQITPAIMAPCWIART